MMTNLLLWVVEQPRPAQQAKLSIQDSDGSYLLAQNKYDMQGKSYTWWGHTWTVEPDLGGWEGREFFSKGSSLTLRLKTGYFVQDHGFTVHYIAVPECGTPDNPRRLRASNHQHNYFSDPAGANNVYQNNRDCYWLIEAPRDHDVRLPAVPRSTLDSLTLEGTRKGQCESTAAAKT